MEPQDGWHGPAGRVIPAAEGWGGRAAEPGSLGTARGVGVEALGGVA
jgi:hypothetical protein